MKWALVAVAVLAGPAAVFAAESSDLRSEYSLQSWNERDGLPSGRIWAITQDQYGYLWLGTEAGLIRFDGVRFLRWTSDQGAPFPDDLIVFSLRAARDGSLWLGFQSGGLGRIRQGKLQLFGPSDGIRDGRIQFIIEDRRGVVWAGGPNAAYQFRDGRWDQAGGRWGLPNGGANDAFEDHVGRLWITTNNGIFVRGTDSDHFTLADPRRANRFTEDAGGTLWVTDQQRGIVAVGGTASPSPQIPAWGQTLLHDRRGATWLGTAGQGVWRWSRSDRSRATAQQVTIADGLSDDNVRALFEDRDGNIWVGTESGLDRLTARKIRPLSDIFDGFAIETTPDGRVWIATSSGVLEYDGDQPRLYGQKDGLPSQYVRALFTDQAGTLWVGTDRGVARRVNGRFEALPIPEFTLSRLISIAADSSGTVWLCDRDMGAFSWRNGQLTRMRPPAPSMEGSADFVYVDRHDHLWIGYPSGVIVEVRPDGQSITHALDNSIGSVLTAIHEDQYGAIWIGGSRGLGRIKGGKVAVLKQPASLPGNGVFAITEDAVGDLWLGVSSGVLRLRQSDFDVATAGSRQLRYRFYDASDGLVGVPPRLGFPGAISRADGTLWFLTTRGASVIRPRDIDRGSRPPTLRIETVKANDQLVTATPGLALPAGTTQLLFEYTAISLTSPTKERFRYKLEGVDDDWVEAGTRREAFYANLGSGRYRLKLARAADDLAAPESAVVWDFSIRPMFYETAWFMASCIGAAGFLGWAAWRIRLRQLRRQFAVVFAERARMSHELHDTLLQNLAAIALHFDELATSTDAALAPFKDQLVRLRRHLEGSIDEARRLVWDLRSGTLEDNGLPSVLHESGGHTFGGSRTRFTMSVSGAPRRCAPAVEHHLMRIAQEALSNAARYAEATAVHLGLHYQENVVRLEVSDDGRGLQVRDDTGVPVGHYGLRIMEERAAKIGAKFRVMTKPGEGTHIEVVAPLATGS